jgi:hypothetical protein
MSLNEYKKRRNSTKQFQPQILIRVTIRSMKCKPSFDILQGFGSSRTSHRPPKPLPPIGATCSQTEHLLIPPLPLRNTLTGLLCFTVGISSQLKSTGLVAIERKSILCCIVQISSSNLVHPPPRPYSQFHPHTLQRQYYPAVKLGV